MKLVEHLLAKSLFVLMIFERVYFVKIGQIFDSVLPSCLTRYQQILLTASPVVSDMDHTEGGRLIFAKFGQCGQHTSQRSPIRSKTIFVTRFGHQEALQFFTI